MQLSRIIIAFLVTICILFLGFQILELDFQAAVARALLLLSLTALYVVTVKDKKFFFYMFLLFFSLAELVNVMSWIIKIDVSDSLDYYYYGANGLYILSYVFLIIRVLTDMNIKEILAKFWIHIVVLTVLDVFCVFIVSGTTEKILSRHEYSLEFIYNSVIMLLLTVGMINYISKNTQKSMNLLLGSIFIFFSEVIQLTYFYVSELQILNIICSVFLVLAFLFLYLQARIPSDSEESILHQDLQY